MTEEIPNKATRDSRHEDVIEMGVLPKSIGKHAIDADQAIIAISGLENVEIDEATNRRLLKRIDRHLMPLLCVVYALNFIDKSTLSFASIMGMKDDIGLKGDNYQWL